MRFQPLSLLFLFVLVSHSLGEPTNYLLEAFQSAMKLKADYETDIFFFRERLTFQADDLAYYFTVRMRYVLTDANTEAQGAALQGCASAAANQSLELIHRFDDSLRQLEEEATQLHVSVLEELIQTNIKAVGVDVFYYYHNYRVEEAIRRLVEVHQVELGNRWSDMWWGYFDIADELDKCTAEAMDRK